MTIPSPNKERPINIGIYINSFFQPRWIYRIIEDIAAASFCHISYLSVKEDASPIPTRFFGGLIRDPNHALFSAYSTLDNRIFHQENDALETLDIHTIFLSQKLPFCAETMDESGLDMCLLLGRYRFYNRENCQARYGVWSLHFGPWAGNEECLAGFYEVLKGMPVTISELHVFGLDGSDSRVIARTFSKTDVRSVRRSRSNFLAKSAAQVMRKLREVHENKFEALVDLGTSRELWPNFNMKGTNPTNLEMILLLLQHGTKYAIEKLNARFMFDQWVIVYQLSAKFNQTASHGYLIPPVDRFWADPFPLQIGDRRYIFFEEFVHSEGKGHISFVVLDGHGATSEAHIALKRSYHLAYPFQFQLNNDHFMIPESIESKNIELYRARSFPESWELVDVIIPNVSAADSTLQKIGDEWWLFSGVAVEGTPFHNEELHLYHSPSPFGPWKPHRRNPIISDIRRARPAGALFEQNGNMVRPSQDCSFRYGYAILFNKITHIDHNNYVEVECNALRPYWDPKIVATHTFNRHGDLTVIDARLRRSRYSRNNDSIKEDRVFLDLESIGITDGEMPRCCILD